MKEHIEPISEKNYLATLGALKRNYLVEKEKITERYVQSNCKYEVGDIFTDHVGSIRIESMSIYHSSYTGPTMRFIGRALKKDLTPTMREIHREAHLSNEEKEPLKRLYRMKGQ